MGRSSNPAGADPRAEQQANTGTLGELSPRFWLLTLATGVAAGLVAILMIAVLRVVQHAAFSYHSGEYSTAVAHHDDLHRVVVLVIGGLVTGAGLWAIDRFLGGTGGQPTEVVWAGRGRLPLIPTILSGLLSEVSIGLGASIGRENAPQHGAAAFGSWIGERLRLPEPQRMLLIACGAGTLGTLAVLGLLKPLVTAMCLRSGAIGGLFTPTMSTGAVLGAFLGHAWAMLWPGSQMASYAMVGSAAMLAAGMRTPAAAIAFALELTNSVNPAILAMLLALAGAMLVARLIDRRSIYSARLSPVQNGLEGEAAG